MKSLKALMVVLVLILGMNVAAEAEEPVWTDVEEKFIKAHPVIHLGIDPGFVPYEFIDTDGEYKGIAADYIKLLSEKTGIEMIIEKGLTWTDAYESAVEKRLDVLPCISKTREREQYFFFSEPYYYFQRVMVVRDNNNSIKGLEDLAQIKVAVQTNSSHHSYLKGYPDISLSLYTNAEDALAAVSNGTEAVFMGNLATSGYLVKSNGFTNLKYVKLDSEEKQALHFAVRKDWSELVGIINKGLASITEEEKIEINNRWIGLENSIDYTPIIRIAAVAGLFILIVLLVSVYWIIILKKEVSKRILMEEDLRHAKIEADIANQVKSSFLARMSHEIRTPLNAITGMAYLIKKTDTTITQKMYLDKITQAALNMLGIINDILDFSKIEAGKVDIERISFSLDNVIQQIMNIVAFKVEEQQIGFRLRKDTKLPDNFFGDPKRLEQILLNIINNAVKFTSSGEVSLVIGLAGKEEGLHHLEFIVRDTGIGMSEDQVAQLFTPFAQGDSSINRRFGGTGLGLSIVKSLVEIMKGEISVQSTQGEGSTFIVKLPLEVDREKEFEDKQKVAAVYFRKIKGLVLDKNITNLNLLEEYLGSFGMIADYVTSQEQAVQLLENPAENSSQPYDLLIVDYDTPEEGGLKFVERIKNDPLITAKPKAIMMIPLMKEELFDKIKSVGIEVGIAKPIIPSVLYNGILEIFKVRELEPKNMSDAAKASENKVPEHSYRVLVVEDNKTNQLIARSILEQSGFLVALVDNGEAGVAYFIEHREELDLILMDLHMPVMNGYDASRQIRKIDDSIPIVAMTADAITGIDEECRHAGINHYISKPFDPEKFVDTITNILKTQKEAGSKDQAVKKSEMQKDLEAGILDEADGLKRMGNNKELFQMVLAEYVEENKATSKLLDQAIEEKNYREAIQIVHKNKGSTGNIGAKKLFTTAADLQKALENEENKEIKRLQEAFTILLNQLLSEIEQSIKE